MTLKALNPFAPFWYTPERDDNKGENPAAFEIVGLNGEQYGRVIQEYEFNESGKFKGLNARGIALALEFGLRDWRHFANDKGEMVYSQANFRFIPVDLRADLAMQICIASEPTETERKN